MQQNVVMLHRELHTTRGIVLVDQRPDGYVNLTQMCQAAGKLVGGWLRNQDTEEYLRELAATMRICIVDLIVTVTDAPVGERHTWGHPRVALKCAAWCNKKFEVQVYQWIEELRTTGVVDLRHNGTPVQNALAAIGIALQEDRNDIGVLQQDMVLVKSEVANVKNNVIRIEDAYGKDQKKRQTNAQRRNAIHFNEVMREKVYRWQGGRCLNKDCRRALWLHEDEAPTPDECMQLDHVRAVHKGGNLTWDNVQGLCGRCHRIKTVAERQGRILDFRDAHPGFRAECERQQQLDDERSRTKEEHTNPSLFDNVCSAPNRREDNEAC